MQRSEYIERERETERVKEREVSTNEKSREREGLSREIENSMF